MPSGGFRPNAGRKKKAVADAILDGTHKERIKIIRQPKEQANDETPIARKCSEYLLDEQKDKLPFLAAEFYAEICEWLEKRRCLYLFDNQYLQRYAMQQARYAQTERLISKYGAITRNSQDVLIINPLEAIAIDRLKQLNTMSHFIINEVRKNCEELLEESTADPMDLLLAGQR